MNRRDDMRRYWYDRLIIEISTRHPWDVNPYETFESHVDRRVTSNFPLPAPGCFKCLYHDQASQTRWSNQASGSRRKVVFLLRDNDCENAELTIMWIETLKNSSMCSLLWRVQVLQWTCGKNSCNLRILLLKQNVKKLRFRWVKESCGNVYVSGRCVERFYTTEF